MGTTVTTNLGLIKPDGNESIQEELPTFPGWAAQNALNCDKIDSLFRHTTHNYTPTWTTDTGSNPTLGASGAIDGKYLRLWPRMVFAYFRIYTGGAGFLTGTGIYRLTLPVAMAPEIIAMNTESALGKAYLHDDSSAATSTVCVVMYNHANNVLEFRRSDGSYWNNTTPFTLAQQDRLSGYIMYPTSAA
jgi:hypothetical protein